MHSKVLMMALAAGCACSGAVAQQDGLRFGGYVSPIAIEINGVRYPLPGGGGHDDNQIVYENGTVGTPAAFTTGSTPKWHMLDQVSFSPGPGAGAGQLVNGIQLTLGFGPAVTMPTGNIDVVVQFWDTLTATATPVTSNSFGNFRLAFQAPAAGWAPNTYYLSNLIDLSMAPGGGYQSADDLIYVDTAYLIAGGQIPAGAHPDASGTFADFNAGVINTVGSSPPVPPAQPTYWRDANGNGQFDPGEERVFAAPAAANFILALQANVVGGVQGACCLADGTCAVMSQSSCATRTGVYRGDNTTCPSNCAVAANETGDAGDLPGTAQVVSGSGPLPGIVGTLGASDADMYKIQVCDAANFIATTTTWSSLDTQLFLFRQDGTGVVSDDDDPQGGFTSRLTNAFVTANGTYYIAVSEYDNDPMSAGGEIWADEPFNAERAPDGPGAAGAVTSWSGAATTGGNYVIAFRGACYIGGAACYPDCNADHALNVLDFVCFQSAFAASSPQADCDHNSALNVLDFVCFQSSFAAGCSQL